MHYYDLLRQVTAQIKTYIGYTKSQQNTRTEVKSLEMLE